MHATRSLCKLVFRLLAVALAAVMIPAAAQSQAYPKRTIKIVVPYAAGGAGDIVAVGSDKRVPLLPDAPTVSEAGVPGFEATVWWGLVAPAKTPGEIVAKLNMETNKALHDSAIIKKLADLGVVTTPGSPEDFARFISRQTDLWSAAIKKAGIRPD